MTTANFPTCVLAYLDIAISGPLAAGSIAHRVKTYPVTVIRHGQLTRDYLIGAACQPATTQPTPTLDPATGPDVESVPVVVCRQMSAAWAQAHGAVRCTAAACYPFQPTEDIPRAG